MTPKEKAFELVERFKKLTGIYGMPKQCALICVDEIINTGINNDYVKQDGYMLSLVEFYAEVKQEIENYENHN